MPGPYSPFRDYRDYAVDDTDGELLTTSAVAKGLDIKTTQGVRSLIKAGRLPAKRHGKRHLVPAWAVHGRRLHTGHDDWPRDHDQGQPPGADRHTALLIRVAELESNLLTLSAAAEHEERAHELQRQALAEMTQANAILKAALRASAIPPTTEEITGAST